MAGKSFLLRFLRFDSASAGFVFDLRTKGSFLYRALCVSRVIDDSVGGHRYQRRGEYGKPEKEKKERTGNCDAMDRLRLGRDFLSAGLCIFYSRGKKRCHGTLGVEVGAL